MLSCGVDVELSERRWHLGRRARHDDHDVRVSREEVDKGGELRVAHLHALKLALCLGARQLELLYYIRHALESVVVVEFGGQSRGVRYDEKRCSLKEHHLVCGTHVGKVAQLRFESPNVGDEAVDDARPGTIQSLVPDTRGQAVHLEHCRARLDQCLALGGKV